MTLVLDDPASKLRLYGERYRVEKDKQLLADVPRHQVTEVILLGGTQVTTQAMRGLMKQGARLHIMTQRGRYLGRLEPAISGGAELLVRQVRQLSDDRHKLIFSCRVLTAKLTSSQQTIRRHAIKNSFAERSIRRIGKLRERVMQAESLELLRGFEGAAARLYFATLGATLDDAWGFHGRNYRPAPDPVNAMLSLGYSLLTIHMTSALQNCGLHPDIGFLHVSKGKRPALALDLMEPLRSVIVDRFVFSLCRRGDLKPSAFITNSSGVKLRNAARRSFISRLEKRFTGVKGRQLVSYEKRIQAEARAFKKALADPESFTSFSQP